MQTNGPRLQVTKLLPFALLLHLFISADTRGQNPAGPPPTAHDQPQTCTVQGIVVSATTGQPLKSARVMLIDRDHRDRTEHPEGFTDAAGQFLITDVPAGTYHFRASKVGYVEQGYHRDAGGPAQLLVIAPGDRVDKVLFRLDRAAVIAGRITDEAGEPAISTEVLALVWDAGTHPELSGEWEPATRGMEGSQIFEIALTNDLGEYRLYSLPPGKYFVAASDLQVQFADFAGNRQPRGLDMAVGLINYHSDNHPLLYYPGVFDPSEAETVAVKAGQETRIDLSLRAVKLVTVSGRVLGLSGKPANDIYVQLISHPRSLNSNKPRTLTDAQGNFEIKKVMPGRYTVMASFDWYDANRPNRYWAEQPLEVAGEEISGLLMQLNGPLELSGKITTTEATKLNLEGLNVYLEGMEIPSGGGGWELNSAKSEHVTKDGIFSVPNAVRTTYRMSLDGLPDNWYVHSATFGSQNVLEDGLQLADGNAGHSLDITLSSGVGQVDGVVLRGENPVPGALVRLLPDPINPFRNIRPSTAWADPKGHFVIPNVVPGSYRAVAYDVEADPAVDEDDPPGLAITLTEKESKTVQLKFAQTP